MKNKKMLFAFAVLLASAPVAAQTETEVDRNVISFGNDDHKEYGDFLIDMSLFAANPPKMPKYDFSVAAMTRDYNKLFSLNNDVVYSKTSMAMSAPYYAFGSFGSSDPLRTMNSASFRLKSGGWFSTFGNYDASGRRNPVNTSPWESQDFRGGFELKSANGNFKFSVEYQYQKNNGLIHNGGVLW